MPADTSSVNLREIAEIELFILRRMKELTLGDHASVFKGPGFHFVGVRDWEPGDRPSSIDWAQSSLTNFSPLITREFEQDSNATIVAVADASMSTRCGAHGATIETAIARAVAAVGLSAVFFQDMFGLVTFDDRFEQLAAARPKIGRSHVIYCVDLYQNRRALDVPGGVRDVTTAIEGQLRRSSLVPVISDFLFHGRRPRGARAGAAQRRARRVPADGRRRASPTSCRRVGRLGGGVRRRDRPDAGVLAPRAVEAGRRA